MVAFHLPVFKQLCHACPRDGVNVTTSRHLLVLESKCPPVATTPPLPDHNVSVIQPQRQHRKHQPGASRSIHTILRPVGPK
ncbi:unnamed protein product [Protopolystoma xenopodis]|uniref:Uncharacterized protein n=1 Tax=Protopolystoma xenopodis TaxID=117903 RepID=A0A3S5BK83_9PLAT|nr:unnamed protein product [Protopolystoma xenopodis]